MGQYRTIAAVRDLPRTSAAAIAIACGYLLWRVAATGSGAAPLWFWLLWLAEAVGVLRLVTELVLVGPGIQVSPRHGPPPPGAAPASTVLVIADDDPLPVVRDSLLGARCVAGVDVVAVVDLHHRRELRRLAQRLRVAYLRPDAARPVSEELPAIADRLAQTVDSSIVIVCASDHVLLPHAGALLAAPMATSDVEAVRGQTDEVNAKRRVDRTGLGDGELAARCIHRRLAAAGALTEWGPVAAIRRSTAVATGFASADGISLALTAAGLVHRGMRVDITGAMVARRLAPGPRALGRHRYSRELVARLRRLGRAPRPSVATLAGLSAWSAALSPLRALQRLTLLAVAAAVFTGSGPPVVAPVPLVASLWLVRHIAGDVARRRVAGPAYEAWIVNDLRVMSCDLASGLGVLRRSWTPQRLGGHPAGDRVRWVVRGAQAATTVLLIAVVTGFTRTSAGNLTTLAAAAGVGWFLAGGLLARRSMTKRQFRRNYRSDDEIPVLRPEGVRVVGLSPTGFDVVSDAPLDAGASCRIVVKLPRGGGGSTPTEIGGVVRRTGPVATGWAGYVAFEDLVNETADLVHEYLAVASAPSVPVAGRCMGETAQSA